jgi:hypothetical protein
MQITLLIVLTSIFVWSSSKNRENDCLVTGKPLKSQNNDLFEVVGDIPVPAGYERVKPDQQSFGSWLRQIRLRKDKTVYLFNGTLKANQSAQFAVLDIYVGQKDLQQCADAVMRLKAEYLLSRGRTNEIRFYDNNGKLYQCPSIPDKIKFEKWLEIVFAYCGTISLEKQLKKVQRFEEIEPGYVLIKGGSPGHTVIVMDVAVNTAGGKLFLLAQSYMPAQSVHLLKNPLNPQLSPWYPLPAIDGFIETPEWTFKYSELKKWP